MLARVALILIALVLAGCTSMGRPGIVERPRVILVSIDGFRPDYLDAGVTPNLSRLAQAGVLASMRPSFPTVTFPNHYTLVTGRHPDRHGIVGNSFVDSTLGRFSMQKTESGWWNQAEPIWITAQKAGLTTATMFWPGSETEHAGIRPHYWRAFDQSVPGDARVDQVLAWMDTDPVPDFSTLYFDTVDTAGHRYGPGAVETLQAVAEVDGSIGRLVQGLRARGLYEGTVIVIVSDHGMAETSPDRVMVLEDLVDPAAIEVVYSGAVVFLNPVPGRAEEARAALVRRHAHGECWDKASIPGRLQFGSHPRVSEIVCAADVGWLFATRSRPIVRSGGAHGYDNQAPEMSALFMASGPGIVRGATLDGIDSVDVHPFIGRLLRIEVPNGDGSLGDILPAFTSSPRP